MSSGMWLCQVVKSFQLFNHFYRCLCKFGMGPVGGELAERNEDEVPQVHTRMRKYEVRMIDHPIVNGNKINVYRTVNISSGCITVWRGIDVALDFL